MTNKSGGNTRKSASSWACHEEFWRESFREKNSIGTFQRLVIELTAIN